MTTHVTPASSRLDAAIAAGAYEVVALRLAMGVLAAMRQARAEAATTRDDLLELMSELGALR